jgi:hypothetical protein
VKTLGCERKDKTTELEEKSAKTNVAETCPTAAVFSVARISANEDFSLDSLKIAHDDCLGGKVAITFKENAYPNFVLRCQRCKAVIRLNLSRGERTMLCSLAIKGGVLHSPYCPNGDIRGYNVMTHRIFFRS